MKSFRTGLKGSESVRRFRADLIQAVKARQALGIKPLAGRSVMGYNTFQDNPHSGCPSVTHQCECPLVMVYQYHIGGTRLLNQHFQQVAEHLRNRYGFLIVTLSSFLGGYEGDFKPSDTSKADAQVMWRLGQAVRRWLKPVEAQ